MNSKSTIKQEADVGRRHTADSAWPTLALTVVLLTGFIASTGSAFSGEMPMAYAAVVNGTIIYACYTVFHEAVHYNIVPKRRNLRWVNVVAGALVAVPLWMFFHHHRRSHMIHHFKTNMAEDPDQYAIGAFWPVVLVKIPWAVLSYLNPVLLHRECVVFKVDDGERRLCMALFMLYGAFVAAVVTAGFGYELLVLWFIPWLVGNTFMLFFFAWVPHHDHSETGRYRDTRISLWPGGDALMLGQNMHLIHHMIPSIPFYRYRAVFDEIRPLMEQNNARIDGFWPTTG